jgi:hypothetical protein
MAQKVHHDTFTLDQLNLYKHKAVNLRNTGMILTFSGPILVITGYYIGQAYWLNHSSEYRSGWPIKVGIGMAGIATTVVGIPMWYVGGSRKFNAELLALDFDKLNLCKDKAINWRNTGIILTSCGIGIAASGFILAVAMNSDASWLLLYGSAAVGIVSTMVGIPLWATGGSRKAKAELTLQKFNIAPENTTALRLGITIRF